MKPGTVLQLAGLIERPREFAAGWIEGRTRWHNRQGDTIPASWFDPRTLGRAASQAAVAYYEALHGD